MLAEPRTCFHARLLTSAGATNSLQIVEAQALVLLRL